MRRAIALSFLLLYLLVNTELQEVIRLPILFEHFAEHKARNTGVSFISFIELHYFSEDVKDSDYHRDQQLPFKGCHCEGVSAATVVVAESFLPSIRVSCIQSKPETYASPFNSSLHHFTIWQPPRA